MGVVGLEPTRPYKGQRILSPQRLPFRHTPKGLTVGAALLFQHQISIFARENRWVGGDLFPDSDRTHYNGGELAHLHEDSPVLAIGNFSLETLFITALYLSLSVLYLLVLPGGLYVYLQKRWYVASSWERTFMYFLVFFLFPGLLLLSPFLNLRPQRRQVVP